MPHHPKNGCKGYIVLLLSVSVRDGVSNLRLKLSGVSSLRLCFFQAWGRGGGGGGGGGWGGGGGGGICVFGYISSVLLCFNHYKKQAYPNILKILPPKKMKIFG